MLKASTAPPFGVGAPMLLARANVKPRMDEPRASFSAMTRWCRLSELLVALPISALSVQGSAGHCEMLVSLPENPPISRTLRRTT